MNIVITGASRGIGYETALEFARDSNNTVIAISRNLVLLEKLEKQADGNVEILEFDLERDDHTNIYAFLKKYDKIDILVNNAGGLFNKKFVDLTIEDWRKMFEVNVFTSVKLIQVCLPLLAQSTQGHIVNVGSMGGFQGTSKFVGLSAYSSSKAALANLTECLAEELKEYNIHVNCLALGAVNTEMLNEAFPGYKAPVDSDSIARFIKNFCTHSRQLFNGKIIPISSSTP